MSPVELKVTTENLPNSRIRLELEVPAERCKASYEEALSRLSRSIKLPGFRKGKVPKAVILQQIGTAQIKATALETLIDVVWREAIDQESLEPLCAPELREGFEALLGKFQTTESLSLQLETDIAPIPKLKKSKDLEAEFEPFTFEPSQIDELIDQSRKQLATLVPVENRSADLGDIAVISFIGTFSDDGSEIDGGSSESMDVELEQGQMIPGFIEGILGMSLNDKKTITCTFPEDYSKEDARGREANFNVKLIDLKSRELPKLDDSFAQQASDKKTMKELREELEKRLKSDAERKSLNNRQEALINVLVEQLVVDLPKTLIDQEAQNLVEQTANKFAQQGMDVKSMFTPKLVKSLLESSREEAKQNLLRKLALSALAKEQDIAIDDKIIEVKFKEVSQELSGEKNIDKEKLRNIIAEDLLQEKLIQWLTDNNSLREKPINKDKSEHTKSSKIKATKSKLEKEESTKNDQKT